MAYFGVNRCPNEGHAQMGGCWLSFFLYKSLICHFSSPKKDHMTVAHCFCCVIVQESLQTIYFFPVPPNSAMALGPFYFSPKWVGSISNSSMFSIKIPPLVFPPSKQQQAITGKRHNLFEESTCYQNFQMAPTRITNRTLQSWLDGLSRMPRNAAIVWAKKPHLAGRRPV